MDLFLELKKVLILLFFLLVFFSKLEAVHLDLSFSSNGIVQHNNAAGGNWDDWARDLCLDRNSKVVVTGASTGPNNPDADMVVWRFNLDGSLDTTFSNKGWIVESNSAGGHGQDWGRGVTVDQSNRIIATGYSFNGVNDDMVTWRFRPDGALDTTFSNKGWVVVNNTAGGNSGEWGYSTRVDANGKVLVAGFSTSPANRDMAIWRFNNDGSFDTTFSNKGWVLHNNAAGGNGNEEAYAMTLDRIGRIVATGYSYNGKDTDMVIWRFNQDGSLDTTFNGQRWVVHNGAGGGNTNDSGRAVAIDANDRIVVAGISAGMNNKDCMVVWRYNPNGTLDTTFNGQGWVVASNAAGGGGYDRARGMCLDPAGRILVTGYSWSGFNADMVLWRLNADGTLDTTFSNKGWVINKNAGGVGGAYDYSYAAVADSTGRIYTCGESDGISGSDMIVWCYSDPIVPSTNTNSSPVSSVSPGTESDVIMAPNPFQPHLNKKTDHVVFYHLTPEFQLTVYSSVGLEVFSHKGVAVDRYDWDVRNSRGEVLKPGIYICKVVKPGRYKKYFKLVVIR